MMSIGDFYGSFADSPSGRYAIAWGGVAATSSLEDKHYRLVSGNQVVLAGKVNNRIFTAKVADDGHFALETITPNNNSILLAMTPSGDVLMKKQTDKHIQHFALSIGGTQLSWITDNHFQILDISTSAALVNIDLPNQVYPDDARYSPGCYFVEVHQANLDWYRFSLDGTFLDEEKWLNDFLKVSDGNTLYHTVKAYYEKISSPTPEDAQTYALWVEDALKRGIKEGFMFSISSIYDYLALLWTKAGDPAKCAAARAKSEEQLDGFRLVDRAISQLPDIGDPPDAIIASRLVADLDRATQTPRLHEYPNYMGKLFRTKGEILERIGDKGGAIAAYRAALHANPKAGCKKQLERLTDAPLNLPEKPKPKPIESRINVDRLAIFHFRCPVCGNEPGEVPLIDYLATWQNSDPKRVQGLLIHLVVATWEIRFGHSRWMTKKFQAQADELIRNAADNKKENAFEPSPYLHSVNDKTLTMQTECPVCRAPPGKRSKDNYFTVWSEACKVQSSNLFYEVGLILFGIISAKPSWMPDYLRDYCRMVMSQTFRTGQSIGLPSCPQCGRFTSAIFGGTRTDPEKGMCRWCMDASGGM